MPRLSIDSAETPSFQRALITTRFGRWLQASVAASVARVVVATSGCEPTLSPEEYGDILSAPPKLKGMDKPYPVPELEVDQTDKDGDGRPDLEQPAKRDGQQDRSKAPPAGSLDASDEQSPSGDESKTPEDSASRSPEAEDASGKTDGGPADAKATGDPEKYRTSFPILRIAPRPATK